MCSNADNVTFNGEQRGILFEKPTKASLRASGNLPHFSWKPFGAKLTTEVMETSFTTPLVQEFFQEKHQGKVPMGLIVFRLHACSLQASRSTSKEESKWWLTFFSTACSIQLHVPTAPLLLVHCCTALRAHGTVHDGHHHHHWLQPLPPTPPWTFSYLNGAHNSALLLHACPTACFQ
jgi:hypothetical protein